MIKTPAPLNKRREARALPQLIREDSGLHVGISGQLDQAAQHCARISLDQYRLWRERDRHNAWGGYKRRYFTIAVGGGNTIKSLYRAWLEHHATDINWLRDVRFFFIEDSTGERGWESPEDGLARNFLTPLAQKLIATRGRLAMTKALDLPRSADEHELIDAFLHTLAMPMDLGEARRALRAGQKARARRLAAAEAARYQQDIQHKLGGSMSFHLLVSGIGKDGTLGAFTPYTPELADRRSAAVVLPQPSGALRIALNRGVLTGAERVALVVSGSLKLKALGRFEMDDAAPFEQTVMETPLRILRESEEIADRVYVFADEQALHFDETVFQYREKGKSYLNKAETRAGDESEGIHALLMHGFMGLFSFTNLLVRLPSAWTVSALHRGSDAKNLDKRDVFPHYAHALRKAILKNWRRGQPSPVAGHSIGGVIADHLLISLLPDPQSAVPAYESLSNENRQLVDALRASGMIFLATWTPADGVNAGRNMKGLVSHLRHKTPLDFSGFPRIYRNSTRDGLTLVDDIDLAASAQSMSGLDRFLGRRIARPLISSLNQGIRRLLGNRKVQQRMLNSDNPYLLRLVNGRLLKVASYYGLIKEINASMHDPEEYQRRHLKALEILLAYDIPSLTLIHEDDFLVSAVRHRQEHQYLLRKRLEKEGVSKESELQVPVRFKLLRRSQEEVPLDPLNPHLLIMATSAEGNSMAREVTAAMTDFVSETVYRATRAGAVAPLDSVARWAARRSRSRGRRRAAA